MTSKRSWYILYGAVKELCIAGGSVRDVKFSTVIPHVLSGIKISRLHFNRVIHQ
jgi:hypothetical protein